MESRRMMVFGRAFATRLILPASGLVVVGLAGTILSAPEAFYAGYGIEPGGTATLVNELKAPAGVLLIVGLLMFAGVVRSEFVVDSLTMAAAIYLSYGLPRLSSMAVDGFPNSSLVGATGVVCLLTLLHIRYINAR